MKTDFADIIHLLHETSSGVLATHSAQLTGYPFATLLPYVVDEHHRPVCLMSSLAEHTKNVLADSRASFLIASSGGSSVLAEFRITLVGDVERVAPSKDLVARYLRYEPHAQQYLDLGDFSFFRLLPKQARFVAGFGEMGWIEETEWSQAEILSLSDETALYQDSILYQSAGLRLLGIDCYGVDIEREGKRERQRFPKPLTSPEKIGESVKRLLAAFGSTSLRLF